jgi:hypothetical protein
MMGAKGLDFFVALRIRGGAEDTRGKNTCVLLFTLRRIFGHIS